ncbi:I78 family peptidase inhibitor [Halomonas sp. GT]|uniref:I78 family peptidase inhibitor n=1 Tax=Halomonas sp. GT TaxID=1971364 RepID=UPI0009F395DE|nr:I78 family peptidase inhibitor [Halomonas sp. GT]
MNHPIRCAKKKVGRLALLLASVLPVSVLLVACAGSPDNVSAPEPPTVGKPSTEMNTTCDADAVQYAIGAPFDEANVPMLQSESGAKQVRVLRPNSAATMDYREDRLNILLESNDMIEALRCG